MATKFPDDLRYTKDHEWARVDGTRARIGITQFAVSQLGDITLVDLPKEGEKFRREQPIATVESVKAVSDVFAPLSGTVAKINDPLRDSPDMLNDDCYDEGWILELELDPKTADEVGQLMSAQEYEQYVKEQDH